MKPRVTGTKSNNKGKPQQSSRKDNERPEGNTKGNKGPQKQKKELKTQPEKTVSNRVTIQQTVNFQQSNADSNESMEETDDTEAGQEKGAETSSLKVAVPNSVTDLSTITSSMGRKDYPKNQKSKNVNKSNNSNNDDKEETQLLRPEPTDALSTQSPQHPNRSKQKAGHDNLTLNIKDLKPMHNGASVQINIQDLKPVKNKAWAKKATSEVAINIDYAALSIPAIATSSSGTASIAIKKQFTQGTKGAVHSVAAALNKQSTQAAKEKSSTLTQSRSARTTTPGRRDNSNTAATTATPSKTAKPPSYIGVTICVTLGSIPFAPIANLVLGGLALIVAIMCDSYLRLRRFYSVRRMSHTILFLVGLMLLFSGLGIAQDLYHLFYAPCRHLQRLDTFASKNPLYIYPYPFSWTLLFPGESYCRRVQVIANRCIVMPSDGSGGAYACIENPNFAESMTKSTPCEGQ